MSEDEIRDEPAADPGPTLPDLVRAYRYTLTGPVVLFVMAVLLTAMPGIPWYVQLLVWMSDAADWSGWVRERRRTR